MEIDTTFIQIVIAFLGIFAQLWIAKRNRIQLRNQASKNIDVQRLVSNRSTASFVADKRQKWIDELRSDIAPYLALTQEIVCKWNIVREEMDRLYRVQRQPPNDIEEDKANNRCISLIDDFNKDIGVRDREHQEKHFKILLRLNAKEADHILLRDCLNNIRKKLKELQLFESQESATVNSREVESLIEEAMQISEVILKREWTRVKQEVAFPEKLIEDVKKSMA
ncbi:hypothetical protein [Chromobacterium haemolyticum]|uniref:hypothetical protein n=1 Tax=Chromobacterium TaxID=535 RepID=UPI004057524B